MGTGVEIAGIAAALGGTFLQMQAADSAASKQQRIMNQAAEQSERLNAKKADTIEKFAQNTFDPTARDQKYEQAAIKNEGSLSDALLSANGGLGAEVNSGATGNVSNDFIRSKATSSAGAAEDILRRTKLLSRQNAGGLMYNDEALAGGGLASDVLGINAEGTRNRSATNAALSSAQNQGSLLGGLLMGAAPAIGNYKGNIKNFIPGMTG